MSADFIEVSMQAEIILIVLLRLVLSIALLSVWKRKSQRESMQRSQCNTGEIWILFTEGKFYCGFAFSSQRRFLPRASCLPRLSCLGEPPHSLLRPFILRGNAGEPSPSKRERNTFHWVCSSRIPYGSFKWHSRPVGRQTFTGLGFFLSLFSVWLVPNCELAVRWEPFQLQAQYSLPVHLFIYIRTPCVPVSGCSQLQLLGCGTMMRQGGSTLTGS